MMTQEGIPELTAEVERKCSTCGHLKVCAAFRAIAPLIENWDRGENGEEGEGGPFDPQDLAMICKEYINLTVLQVLQGDRR